MKKAIFSAASFVFILSLVNYASAETQLNLGKTHLSIGERTTIQIAGMEYELDPGPGELILGIVNTSPGHGAFDITNAVIDYKGGGGSSYVLIWDDKGNGASDRLGIRNFSFGAELWNWTEPPLPWEYSLVSGIGFTGVSEGVVDLVLISSYRDNVIASAQITVTPEPLTIGLLSFGVLFLRRRK